MRRSTWVLRLSDVEFWRSSSRFGNTDGRYIIYGEGPSPAIAGVAEKPKNSPVLAVGMLLILIGLFAFFAVLLRLA
jgi:hypothetical protein